jgi:hypothetical protein
MLWKINLNRTLVDKNLKKLFEAKIDKDRTLIGMTFFLPKK